MMASMPKVYRGTRSGSVISVYVSLDGAERAVQHDSVERGEPMFDWGFYGGPCSRLALALCADASNDMVRASRVCEEFKRLVIANLPEQSWTMTQDEVLTKMDEIEEIEEIEEIDTVVQIPDCK